MTSVELVLFAAALIAAVTAAVTRTTWPYRAPCAALVLWGSGCAAAGSAVVLAVFALFADPHPYQGRTVLLGLAGAVATLLAAVIVGRVVREFLRVAGGARRRRERHSTLVDLFGTALPGHSDVAVLDRAEAFAYSLPGTSHPIVVSRGLLDRLGEGEVNAVLAHERHHLAARHHLILHLGQALTAALPWWRSAGPLAERLTELVEMCADCSARRCAGARPTAGALMALTDMKIPRGAVPAGGRAVGLRLHHLLNDTRCCRSMRAVTMFGISGITAVSPAIGTAIVLLAELCVWACL